MKAAANAGPTARRRVRTQDPVEELGRRIRITMRRTVRQSIFARAASVAYGWVSPEKLVVVPRTLGRISRRVRAGHVGRKLLAIGLWDSVKESRAFSVGRLWAPFWYVLRRTVARPLAAAILAVTGGGASLSAWFASWGSAAWNSIPTPWQIVTSPLRLWLRLLDAADSARTGGAPIDDDRPITTLATWSDGRDAVDGDDRRRVAWTLAAITGVVGVILMFLMQFGQAKPGTQAAEETFALTGPTEIPRLGARPMRAVDLPDDPPPAAPLIASFDPPPVQEEPPAEPARTNVDWEDPIWGRLGIKPPSDDPLVPIPETIPEPEPEPLPEPRRPEPPDLVARIDFVRREIDPDRAPKEEEFLVRSSPRDRAEPVSATTEVSEDWARFAPLVRAIDARSQTPAYVDRLHPLDRSRMLAALKAAIEPEGDVSSRSDLKLRVTKKAPRRSITGEPIEYQLVVRNDGGEMVERVVVEDVVPASHRVLNVAPLALLDDRTLRWQLDRLRPGEEQTLNVELQPDGEGSIETTSTVRAYAAVSFQTEVAGPRLKLEVISPERVAVGQPFPIRYRITNTGAAAAEHVLLREDLPSELTHRDGRRLDCDLGTLEPGETREALLTAMAATPGATAHQVKVQADGGSADEVERSVLIAEAPARREVPVERPPEPRPPVRRPPPRPEPRPPVRPPSPPPVFCVPAPHCCP